ncbi:MAG: hypothetical protein J7J17_01170 [Hadesarchaea archaeon]|nr:hypothetical protein [Hadesarchaea archaeon]
MQTHPLTWLGIFFILLGVALVLIPVLRQYIDVSKVPPWLIYVYHSDGFYFATSPILILISIISLVIFLIERGG